MGGWEAPTDLDTNMSFTLLVAVMVIRMMIVIMKIMIVQAKDDHHQDGHQNDFKGYDGHHHYDQYCDKDVSIVTFPQMEMDNNSSRSQQMIEGCVERNCW